MIVTRRLVLDVLKPLHPNVLDFGKVLADQGSCWVKVTVLEMDDQTQTLEVVVEGDNIDFEAIQAAITDFGASLHSIDEVEVESGSEPGPVA